MDYRQFFVFDAIGVIAWSFSITLLGYFIGSKIPGIEKMIEPVLILIILASVGPTIYHMLKDPKYRTALKKKFRRNS